MSTFIMFGRYSPEAVQQISRQRTKQATELIERYGGKVVGMYATLGRFDLVFIVSFPGNSEAMKASVALSKTTAIGFHTVPAISVQDFDALVAGV